MTGETALLTWKPGPYSSHYGSAGGIALFSISRATIRNVPRWNMRTGLPGVSPRDRASDDLEELKATAEKVLAGWIARVTGVGAVEH